MSTIHEALTKAQEQKESKDPVIRRMGKSTRKKPWPARKAVVLVLAAAAGISLALAGVSWFKVSAPEQGASPPSVAQNTRQGHALAEKAPRPAQQRGTENPSPPFRQLLNRPAPEKPDALATIPVPGPARRSASRGFLASAQRAAKVSEPGSAPQPGLPAGSGDPTQPSPAPPGPHTIREAEALYAGALDHQKAGRPGKAEAGYNACLEKNPAHARCLNNLAVIHMARGEFDAARAGLTAASQADAAYVDPLYNLACLAARQGNAIRAGAYLKVAIMRDKNARSWAESDPDFDAVRQEPAFISAMEEAAHP